MNITMTYGGLSHLDVQEEEQVLYLHSSAEGEGSFDIEISNVTVFREALATFFSLIKKELNYRPSSEASGKANDLFQSMRKETSKTLIEAQQMLHHTLLQKYDPKALIGLDAFVTVTEDSICFEVFSKRGTLVSMLELSSDLFTGDLKQGTTNICLTFDFVQSLDQLTPRKSLRVKMGTDIGGKSEYTDDLKKVFPCESLWIRQMLLLNTAPLGRSVEVPMQRIDLFNLMMYLRLNRGKKDDYKEFAVNLKPGTQPRFHVEPYGWDYDCSGENFKGDRALEMLFFDHRDLMKLDRVMPYVEDVKVNLMATSLPSQWELNCGSFRLLYMTSGFSPQNWNRRLQFESMLPKIGSNRNETVLLQLKNLQRATLSDVVEKTGLSEDLVSKALRHEVQIGNALYLQMSGEYLYRPLFGELDIEEYRYLGRQDKLAYDLVAEGRVEKFAKKRATGEIEFRESAEKCSMVREPKKEGQEEEPVFRPRMILKTSGKLGSVGCDCAHWKAYGERKDVGGPCAHLRALWLQHCVDIEQAKEMEEDEALLTKRYSGRKLVREITIDLAGAKKKLIEEFAPEKTFRDKRRRVVTIYSNEDQARHAFQQRCKHLEKLGFQSVGG